MEERSKITLSVTVLELDIRNQLRLLLLRLLRLPLFSAFGGRGLMHREPRRRHRDHYARVR